MHTRGSRPLSFEGSVDKTADHALRQLRLSRFGRVVALLSLVYVGLNASVSIWLRHFSFNLASVPMLIASAAFGTLWLLLRGQPRTPGFVRAVELSTLFVGTGAFSSVALVLDLTASPDMIARSAVTYLLLVYAVYVPSSARRTLLVALLMTIPLLGCIFLAFHRWDPALYDPPAATWPKGKIGDMAYPATLVSAALWSIVVAIAAGFSQTIYGLRKAVSDIRRLGQYTLEKKLGEGGMGVVYRASHAMLRRPTAIKLILPDRADNEALLRFEREVRRTAMLTHPNTVTVFDYGRTTGTPLYIAPETLLAQETVDARADLYALGAVGYWLLTGTHVFDGKSVIEVFMQHVSGVPELPSVRLNTPVAADLEQLILDCLAKRPEDRPASAHILRDRLRACAAAGLWTNARAAQWWAEHRHQLRSGGAEPKAKAATGDVRSPHLTVTRMADSIFLGSD